MPKTLQQVVALQVQRAIEERGFRTREEFAFEAGISRATLNRVLAGTNDLRLFTMETIAKTLDVSVTSLLAADPSALPPGELPKRSPGAKKRSGIVVKILVPKGEDAPDWLVDACRKGAGQIEPEPVRRRAETSGATPRRAMGLKEILKPQAKGWKSPK